MGSLSPAGCGQPAGPAAPPQPTPAAARPDAGAATPDAAETPSPVAAAEKLADQTIAGVDGLQALTGAASALDGWIEEHPDHAEVGAAHATTARLDIMAVGAATALDTQAAWDVLEARAPTAEKVLRRAIASLDAAEAAGATETSGLREAAAAMLGLDPDVKDVRLEREALLQLVGEARPEATAVRAVWGGRLLWALDALATLPSELGAEVALRTAGRLLCPRCADLHHLTPDRVTGLLLDESNRGGIICDAALGAAKEADSPARRVAALSNCPALAAAGGRGEPPLLWRENPALVGLLLESARVAALDVPPGPLAGILGRQMASLRAKLDNAWALPVTVVDAPLEQLPANGRTTLASIDGLSSGGLSVARPALGVISIGPEGVRAGLRPVVAVEKGVLFSRSASAELPAGGRVVHDASSAQEASPGGAKDVIPAVASAATEIARAEDALAPKVLPPPALPTEGMGRAMTLVVDAEASATEVVRVIDTLREAGVTRFRFDKTQTHGRELPLVVREAPEALETQVPVGFHRPIIAVVGPNSVEVWRPAGPDEDNPPTGDADKELPPGATPSYRGVDIARLTVTAAGGAALGPADAANAVDAIEWFMARTGAGPVVHVVAGEGARAADVLRVADQFQSRTGKALADPGAIWPGTSCGGEAYDRLRRAPTECPTGVAVAFSAVAPPEGRGLTSSPAGNVKRSAAAAPTPAPAAGFCDKRAIQNGMAVRKGSFRFCYERELRTSPALQGRVEMRFVIGLDGKVSGEPKITGSTLKNPAVESCLVDSVKKATFAAPDGGVCTVNWPFRFEPR
ncbi:MAG: AgmX/PglI C-terminal domain-containing protein [Deltaproteobacteria bacterium]|nr:AgmX/PglI C-terminal domain-containing protein [Deltaproteobacteria bacterium]